MEARGLSKNASYLSRVNIIEPGDRREGGGGRWREVEGGGA